MRQSKGSTNQDRVLREHVFSMDQVCRALRSMYFPDAAEIVGYTITSSVLDGGEPSFLFVVKVKNEQEELQGNS